MTESQARTVDALCKIAGTLALIIGGGWTLYTYFHARASEARTASIEAKKPFLAKKLEFYAEAVDITAKVAIEDAGLETLKRKDMKDRFKNEFVKNSERFTELEIEMELVEDKSVRDAMHKFGECFDSETPCRDLPKLAGSVAQACRESIRQGWDVDLSEEPITYENLERLRN